MAFDSGYQSIIRGFDLLQESSSPNQELELEKEDALVNKIQGFLESSKEAPYFWKGLDKAKFSSLHRRITQVSERDNLSSKTQECLSVFSDTLKLERALELARDFSPKPEEIESLQIEDPIKLCHVVKTLIGLSERSSSSNKIYGCKDFFKNIEKYFPHAEIEGIPREILQMLAHEVPSHLSDHFHKLGHLAPEVHRDLLDIIFDKGQARDLAPNFKKMKAAGSLTQAQCVEYAEKAAKLDSHLFMLHLSKFGIEEPEEASRLLKVAAAEDGGPVIKAIVSSPEKYPFINTDDRVSIFQIAACNAGGVVAENLSHCGLIKRKNTTEFLALALRCAQSDTEGFCLHVENFLDPSLGLTFGKDKEWKEICISAARSHGEAFAEHMGKFPIEWAEKPDFRFQMAMLAAGATTPVALNVQNFNLNEGQLYEVGKRVANNPHGYLASHFEKFALSNEAQRIDLAKRVARVAGYSVVENFEKFRIEDSVDQIEVLKLALRQNGGGVSRGGEACAAILMRNSPVKDPDSLKEIWANALMDMRTNQDYMDCITNDAMNILKETPGLRLMREPESPLSKSDISSKTLRKLYKSASKGNEASVGRWFGYLLTHSQIRDVPEDKLKSTQRALKCIEELHIPKMRFSLTDLLFKHVYSSEDSEVYQKLEQMFANKRGAAPLFYMILLPLYEAKTSPDLVGDEKLEAEKQAFRECLDNVTGLLESRDLDKNSDIKHSVLRSLETIVESSDLDNSNKRKILGEVFPVVKELEDSQEFTQSSRAGKLKTELQLISSIINFGWGHRLLISTPKNTSSVPEKTRPTTSSGKIRERRPSSRTPTPSLLRRPSTTDNQVSDTEKPLPFHRMTRASQLSRARRRGNSPLPPPHPTTVFPPNQLSQGMGYLNVRGLKPATPTLPHRRDPKIRSTSFLPSLSGGRSSTSNQRNTATPEPKSSKEHPSFLPVIRSGKKVSDSSFTSKKSRRRKRSNTPDTPSTQISTPERIETPGKSPLPGYYPILQNILEEELQISGVKDIVTKFNATFGNSRNPSAIFVYAARLNKLSNSKPLDGTDSPRALCFKALKKFVTSVLEGNYTADRYDDSDSSNTVQQQMHSRIVSENDPGIWDRWKQGSKKSLAEMKGLREGRDVNIAADLKETLTSRFPQLTACFNAPSPQSIKQSRDRLIEIKQRLLSQVRELSGNDNQKEILQGEISDIGLQLDILPLLSAKDHAKKKKVLSSKLPGILKKISPGDPDLRACFEKLNRDLNGDPEASKYTGWTVEDSDDWQDMFFSGTEVSGSCQHVDYDPEYNKCLMAYPGDRKNRVIVIKDSSGKIVARRLIRLLYEEDSKKGMVFMEKLYKSTACTPEMEGVVEDMCVMQAKERGLSLISKTSEKEDLPPFKGKLRSYGSNAPYEYQDSGGGTTGCIRENGVFTIPRNPEALSIMYSAPGK